MSVHITVYTQNSIRIESGQIVLYVDPFEITQDTHDATYIFITHDHYDHFDPASIAKVAQRETILFAPEKMAGKVRDVEGEVKELRLLAPGAKADLSGFTATALPAYNVLKPFHPKSAGYVGYLFTIDGEKIYIAGDTDATKEAKAVTCDIALIPIGGTYTCDVKAAAELTNTIRPKTVIPVHYGSIVGDRKDGERFAKLVDEGIEVQLLLGK